MYSEKCRTLFFLVLIWFTHFWEGDSLCLSRTALSSRRQILGRGWLVAGGILIPASSDSCSARNLPEVSNIDVSKVATLETLLPIVTVDTRIRDLTSALQAGTIDDDAVRKLINQLPSKEKSFNELFDAYSDPVSYKQKFLDQNAFLVYYTKGFDGPGRPSIEDDIPVRQSIQYGYRNEAWVGWSSFLAEWQFHEKYPADSTADDLLGPLRATVAAIDSYLSLVPSLQMEQAKRTIR